MHNLARPYIAPTPDLTEDEVHLWSADMDDPAWQHGYLLDLLSAEERARAQRYRLTMLRQRFIASHGLQRLLLASYTGQPPRDLRFTYGSHGKPNLIGSAGPTQLRFNVAHSQNLLLCAVTCNKEVGVDVEYQRPLTDMTGVAKNSFTDREFLKFSQADPGEKREHFFRLWTCKEAYLKATGEGIASMDSCDINLQRDEDSSFSSHVSIIETSRKVWTIYSFSPADGFAAALAVEGRSSRISQFKQLGH